MINKDVMVAPSILAADFGHLADEIRKISEDADYLHFDVMDGHYVPNISFGIPVLASIRKYTTLMFDVHLMIQNPERYIAAFAQAGADLLTFHVETAANPVELAREIRRLGKKPGISIHPDTPIEALREVLPEVDIVLVMSVRPGFGGQGYLPSATDRIRGIRQMLDAIGSHAILSVDGGITKDNCGEVADAGATLLVAGSTVFGSDDPAYAIRELKECAML